MRMIIYTKQILIEKINEKRNKEEIISNDLKDVLYGQTEVSGALGALQVARPRRG